MAILLIASGFAGVGLVGFGDATSMTGFGDATSMTGGSSISSMTIGPVRAGFSEPRRRSSTSDRRSAARSPSPGFRPSATS